MGRPVLPIGMARPELIYGYAGIRVHDLDRSLKFYRGLGFRIRRRGIMNHGGEWVQMTLPGRQQKLELNHYPNGTRFDEPYRNGSELDHLGFFTPDVSYWVRRARKFGGTVAVDFTEPGERLAYVKDPDGIWVEFCGPPRPGPKRKAAST